MSRHLTGADIVAIEKMLDTWTGPVTWGLIVERCLATRRIRPSRQTLADKKPIYAAYLRADERFKNPPSNPLPFDLEAAHARIDRLTAENRALEEKNERLHEQFVRWQKNAAARGVSEQDLNEPLSRIDRGQTPEAD